MYERVLVIEESTEVSDFLSDYILKPRGFEVLTASNGLMGLEMAVAKEPDLIILEQKLSRLTGIQVLEKLKERGLSVPTILTTAYGSEETAVAAFRLGVRDYIIKPFDADEIADSIDRALREIRLQRERDQLVMQLMQTNSQLQRRAQELNVLYGVGKSVSSSLNLEEVFSRIVEAAVYVAGAEEGKLMLLDEDQGELYIRATKNMDSITEIVHEPVSDRLASRVLETQRAIAVGKDSEWKRTQTDLLAKSLIYVPLILQKKSIGVLGVSNRYKETAFDDNDARVMLALAGYATIAINNAQLYEEMEKRVAERTQAWQEAQEKISASEKLAAIGAIGAEFVHRMNNLAGTIPVRINLAKELLDQTDPKTLKVNEQLNQIETDAHRLLQAAKGIRLSTGVYPPEHVSVNKVLEEALDRVWFSHPGIEKKIEVVRRYCSDNPVLVVERNNLLETLYNVIKNGVDAMPEGGALTLVTSVSLDEDKEFVEITTSDTGHGISQANLSKVFDFFFTTKEEGLGFGLWRDKTFIKGLGGDIEVYSQEGKGTKFVIQIPANLKIRQ